MDNQGHSVNIHKRYELFYMSDAVRMTGLCSKTLRRYKKAGKIKTYWDDLKHAHLFPLEEINRIRRNRSLPELCLEDTENYAERKAQD
jgi:hypothetical protein